MALAGIVVNDDALLKKAGQALMQSLRGSKARAENVLSGAPQPYHQPRPGARVPPNYDFSGLRFVHALLNQYDLIDGDRVLAAEERSEFRDFVFWVVERFMTSPIRELNRNYDDRRHNFHSDTLTIIGTTALCFPDHPKASEWLDYSVGEFAWQMENGVEDGAWHETPTYHSHITRTLLLYAYALKRNANVDFFANPGFRGLLDWFVRGQTSPDRSGSRAPESGDASRAESWEQAGMLAFPRHAVSRRPALGDANWSSGALHFLGTAAAAYKDTDPEFAGRLMWGWQRIGGAYDGQSDLILIDPQLPAIPPKLASDVMPKIGYAVLRSEYDTPREKYFLFTCGHRRTLHWASHAHRDLNSFSLFAHGVPLALDAGTGPYRTPEQDLYYKATISHNTVMFGGRDQILEDGAIIKHVCQEKADYVVGDARRGAMVTQFDRHVVFVKPDYFVIWDFIRSYVPSEWILHSPAREIVVNERMLEFVTPWDTNLDVHFLLPTGILDVSQHEGPVSSHPVRTQKYVKVKNAPGKDYLTILHPRPTGDERLTARLIGNEENVMEIKIGQQTDIVMLFPMAKDFNDSATGIAMTGSVGIVRSGPRSNDLILLDGARLSHGGRSITS